MYSFFFLATMPSVLCPTETSVGTRVDSPEVEDLGFGVMSLCPRAEQRFCACFGLDAEPPLVPANLRARSKNQPWVSAGETLAG